MKYFIDRQFVATRVKTVQEYLRAVGLFLADQHGTQECEKASQAHLVVTYDPNEAKSSLDNGHIVWLLQHPAMMKVEVEATEANKNRLFILADGTPTDHPGGLSHAWHSLPPLPSPRKEHLQTDPLIEAAA